MTAGVVGQFRQLRDDLGASPDCSALESQLAAEQYIG